MKYFTLYILMCVGLLGGCGLLRSDAPTGATADSSINGEQINGGGDLNLRVSRTRAALDETLTQIASGSADAKLCSTEGCTPSTAEDCRTLVELNAAGNAALKSTVINLIKINAATVAARIRTVRTAFSERYREIDGYEVATAWVPSTFPYEPIEFHPALVFATFDFPIEFMGEAFHATALRESATSDVRYFGDRDPFASCGAYADQCFHYMGSCVSSLSRINETNGTGVTPMAPVVIRTNLAAYRPSDVVTIQWSGWDGNAKNWIGLYREDASPRTYLSFVYTGALAAGSTTLNLSRLTLTPGTYRLRAFPNNQYGPEVAALSININ